MNTLSRFILGLQSGATRAVELLVPAAGLAEAVAGVVDGVDGHAGVLDEEVLHGTGLHLDGCEPAGGEAGRRGDEPALLHGARLEVDEAGLAGLRQVLQGGR